MESMATLTIPRSATASVTISACSGRSSSWLRSRISGRLALVRQSLEFQRPEVIYHVHFGGGIEHVDDKGPRPRDLASGGTVQAVAYDTPIVGWRGQHVNALRLWSARSPDPLKLDVFNTGDYLGASAEEARAEAICKFLYPNDESSAGRELRLRQEYFFVSPRCRIW